MKKLIRITTIPLSLDKLLGEQLRFMSEHFDLTAVAADKPELEKVAGKYGVGFHHAELTRAITPVADLKALFNLYRYFRKTKPEIVHTHTPKAGLIGMMAAHFAGVPVKMHTVAGLPLLEATGVKRKILNFTEKLTYRFADKVYPNSFAMKEIILKNGFCKSEKLEVIGNGSSNGIDLQHFNPQNIKETIQTDLKSRLNIRENDFVFIFVGRLVKDKGINELVAAFKQLKNSSDTRNPRLLLVGPFEQELDPLLPETLKEIESDDNIISVGFQEDVRPYFAIADALVFPSYREGFPNVVMQAGAMELPSIVSNINGCNEIILEGENGIIIPAKDQEKLHAAMARLLSDRDLYSNLKNNSRKMIQQRYEQSVVWEALLKEYHHLLKKAIV